ncbi:MAG TPA: dTDP-glucose 4,6-dehydratase [Candidatus Thermoplasmatota archaeon]|nr:dTDP-glucose 4,6-dehydratase [Candidatus Thermoplasmatota archaeon]
MRILVTGGAGFIGSNFVHYLFHQYGGAPAEHCCPDHKPPTTAPASTDLQVLNFDALTYAGSLHHLRGIDQAPGYRFEKADICDTARVNALVNEFRPEAIIHFAAESHVDRSIEAGDVFVRTNVLGTQVLLDAARRYDVGQFLHVSTDEVYGSIEKGSFHEGSPLSPSSPYSASKAGSDLLVLAHHHTYGLPVAITRCTNNYGPRQNPEKLLPKIITLASQNKPLPIYGTGMNVRDWLYVKDHCEAIDLVRQQRRWGEIWNIGASDERPNLEVVHAVLRKLGKPDSLIQFVKDRPGHDWRYSLDSGKLRKLGWKPRVTFEEGLRHTIGWLSTHPAEVRP